MRSYRRRMDESSLLATFRRTQLNEWMPRSRGRQSVKVRQLCFSAAISGCDCVITDSATLKYQFRVLNTIIWATAFRSQSFEMFNLRRCRSSVIHLFSRLSNQYRPHAKFVRGADMAQPRMASATPGHSPCQWQPECSRLAGRQEG
jgi:hypothetical protein